MIWHQICLCVTKQFNKMIHCRGLCLSLIKSCLCWVFFLRVIMEIKISMFAFRECTSLVLRPILTAFLLEYCHEEGEFRIWLVSIYEDQRFYLQVTVWSEIKNTEMQKRTEKIQRLGMKAFKHCTLDTTKMTKLSFLTGKLKNSVISALRF